jgi:hypothetical protein
VMMIITIFFIIFIIENFVKFFFALSFEPAHFFTTDDE